MDEQADPVPDALSLPDTLSFVCPRCHTAVEERFYGPCEACRMDLRATMRLEARQIEVEAYTPKMNVVPNQVALKE
jgi:hypothetical protein